MKAKLIAMALPAIVTAALASAAMPTTAGATCSVFSGPLGHCYAEYQWATPYNTQLTPGVAGWINVYCPPIVPNPYQDFVNDEVWAGMNDGSWVEAGVKTGLGHNGYPYTSPADFIASERGGSRDTSYGQYWEFVYGWQTTAQAIPIYLMQAAPYTSSQWNAYTPGTGWIGIPGYANNYAMTNAEAGLETTTSANRDFAVISSLSYETPGVSTSGSWRGKWGTWGGTNIGAWVDQGLSMIWGPDSNFGSAAWVDMPPGYYCHGAGVSRVHRRAFAASLDQQADNVAAGLGDTTPTSMKAAIGVPFGDAIANSGISAPGIPSTRSTDVIQLTGHFSDDSGQVPRGHPAPTGTIATTVVDQATGRPLAFGLTNSPPQVPLEHLPSSGTQTLR
jgi:hypothetical protein